ncbi:hypothetical protein EDC52_103414 [Biostraticola tofi]|uniref:Uncharacterized protein n=1 Tax=Biostraticola tofi TaxID=466109 RepID=A0A4R3Z0F5_9GAMM|nr:hypothetical protein EDC52_103414 [Biostraticola tofi]
MNENIPIAILPMGRPPEDVRDAQGEQPDWFCAALSVIPVAKIVIRPFLGEPLPEPINSVWRSLVQQSLTLTRAPYRFPELPHCHGIMSAVVITGNRIEVRQAEPILVVAAVIESQQTGLRIASQ